MPGSGKSSLGRRLSKKLGMPLVDTDVLIETLAGMRISDIFAAQGEAAFRDLESRCAREAAALSGVIISTGGGMILRPENMDILAQNGLILFIDRHPAHIVRDMR
ncbi:MAG: shikimate kinase, partial [Alistipes sp.]|nr:shikimate kinase [Alistipes sp.]